MAEQKMTAEQLADFTKKTVETFLGAELGKQIQENVNKALAAQGPPEWAAKIFGREEKAAPKTREKGTGFARFCCAVGALKQRGLSIELDNIAKQLDAWGDKDLSEVVIAHKTMQAANANSGGFLVPVQFSQDVIEYLRPATVMRRLGCPTLPMPTGTVRVPKITGASTAAYLGEATNLTKSELQTGQIQLTFKKLGALVPISNDLLRYSSPGADAIVRNDIVRQMAVAEDQAFIRGTGLASNPKGLRYWAPAANVIAANGTQSLANTITDLGKLVVQLRNNNVPMSRPVWIFAPRTWNWLMTATNTNGFFVFRDEVMKGSLWGYPFGVTTSVPINLTDQGGTTESEVYLVDLDDCVIGESQNLIVDVSNEAAYYDGSTVQASFSRDETVVRAIQEHDFAVRRDVAVALLNGVTWT